jgi:hypothetical protein
MFLEGCGTHAYRKPVRGIPKGTKLFCGLGCGCYKDSNGFFGGPDGVEPKGECPKALTQKPTGIVHVDADATCHY